MASKSLKSNKSLWFVIIILSLGALNITTHQKTSPDQTVQTSYPTPTQTQPTPEIITLTPTPPTNTQTHLVTRVVDGDTIVIDTGQSVRYIGIDTPETVHPGKPAMCYGPEASKRNKELVEGKSVILERDFNDIDKYKRLLRHVWIDGVLVSEQLVKEGYAVVSTYPPDIKYQEVFVKAQKQAQDNKTGLWGNCGFFGEVLSTTNSAPPVDTNGCNIKGNISASGDKIYHLPGCGSYSKTVIDPTSGERMFCTETEAQQAGWRKAKNCN